MGLAAQLALALHPPPLAHGDHLTTSWRMLFLALLVSLLFPFWNHLLWIFLII
jgi:hypothetical protein